MTAALLLAVGCSSEPSNSRDETDNSSVAPTGTVASNESIEEAALRLVAAITNRDCDALKSFAHSASGGASPLITDCEGLLETIPNFQVTNARSYGSGGIVGFFTRAEQGNVTGDVIMVQDLDGRFKIVSFDVPVDDHANDNPSPDSPEAFEVLEIAVEALATRDCKSLATVVGEAEAQELRGLSESECLAGSSLPADLEADPSRPEPAGATGAWAFYSLETNDRRYTLIIKRDGGSYRYFGAFPAPVITR